MRRDHGHRMKLLRQIGPFFDSAGPDRSRLSRHEATEFGDQIFPLKFYENLSEFRAPTDGSAPSYFTQSKSLYSPGYEANSIDVDPRFASSSPTVGGNQNNDLRLTIQARLRMRRHLALPQYHPQFLIHSDLLLASRTSAASKRTKSSKSASMVGSPITIRLGARLDPTRRG